MLSRPWKQEFFKLSNPFEIVATCVPAAPVASPSPSEEAVYGGLSSSASGIFVADEVFGEAPFGDPCP